MTTKMKYTIKKLATLSGVSSRTLRYYDEINLLNPACIGEQGYRYYGEDELLRLQQILFYRELGFSLSDIQSILDSDDFNRLQALKSHKQALVAEQKRLNNLMTTIDNTILHLRGQITMNDKELYYGFDSKKQKQHEQYLIDEGIVSREFLDDCNKKLSQMSKEEKLEFVNAIEIIMQKLIEAIDSNISVDSDAVQALLQEHYQWLTRTWTPDNQSYLGLIELYKTPAFSAFYDERHPKLLAFMCEAMAVFAKGNFK